MTIATRIGTLSKLRKVLLICGILASLVYVSTDILAGTLYADYSFTSQAVSELFAIGAPTSGLVVPLFTLSSVLLGAFAFGVWMSAGRNRALRVMALMVIGNAVNSLVLWNFFPMHMRGADLTVTDTMHGILAINPFVLLTVVLGGRCIPKLVPLLLDRDNPITPRACHFGIYVPSTVCRKPAYTMAWAY
jgi:hypothetical protein